MLFFSSYLLHNILFKWEKWTPQILIIWVKNNQNIFWCSSPLLSIILPAHNSPLFSNLSCLFPKYIRLWACRWVWAVVFFCWLLPQRVDDMEHISEDSIIPTPQFQCLEAQGVFPFDDPSSSSSGCGSVLHYPHSGKEPCECSIHCLESPFQRERLRQVTVSLKTSFQKWLESLLTFGWQGKSPGKSQLQRARDCFYRSQGESQIPAK